MGAYYFLKSMNNSYLWYQALTKPSWAPPSWLFGPVWSVLYVGIFITFGYVFYRKFYPLAGGAVLPWMVILPFALNLVFNVIFTPLQFGLKSNILAAVDITFILGTLIWAFVAIWPHARWIVFVNIPYLLWVSFATVLQFTITYLNR